MTNLCSLHFEILYYVHDELADDLGKDLAIFLQEFLDGDDFLEVRYIEHSVKG